MKKVLKCCSALMLTAMILMMLVGCGGTAVHFENGDFKFCSRTLGLYIEDLTAEGRQKRVLIVPGELDGVPIEGLQNRNLLWGGGTWHSEKLEKLYLPWNMKADAELLDGCHNMHSVFILNYDPDESPLHYIHREGLFFYVNQYLFEEIYSGKIFGRPANVSYYYNDGRTENYGCYWIDNVPYGSILDVLPPEDPISEDKIFSGWYKEPECINKWDFETDTTPEERVDEDGNVIYQETALYAKWI